ncbi:MAG: hypothetical protein Q8865_04955 [Bacillota bacterium]|nr:hypothetical protein [Bacillota bacterium]
MKQFNIRKRRRISPAVMANIGLLIAFAACFALSIFDFVKGITDENFSDSHRTFWENFLSNTRFLSESWFWGLLLSTVTELCELAFFGGVIVLLLGKIMTLMPKYSKLRGILTVFFILTLLLPSDVYGAWWISAAGGKTDLLMKHGRDACLFILAMRYSVIPVVLIHVLGMVNRKVDRFLPLKAACLSFMTVFVLPLPDFLSMSILLKNDLTSTLFCYMNVLNVFNKDDIKMNVALLLMRLLFIAVMFVPISHILKDLFITEKTMIEFVSIRSKMLGGLTAFIILSVIYFVPYIVSGHRLYLIYKLPEFFNILKWLFVSAIPASAAAALAVFLSKFALGNGLSRKIGTILLTAVTIFASQHYFFSDFLLSKNNIGTALGSASFSALSVWTVYTIRRRSGFISKRRMWQIWLGVTMFMTGWTYGNTMPALMYFGTFPEMPMYKFHMMVNSVIFPQISIGLYGFLAAVPAVALCYSAFAVISDAVMPMGDREVLKMMRELEETDFTKVSML